MEYAFRNTLTRFLLVFTVLALLAGTVWAQGTGEITGLVSDPQGAVVSDAQVTLTNSATGDKRTTTTSAAGIYRFPQLPIVGTYTVEVAPKGFKAVKVSGIVASVGTVVTQDVKLELGATTEQVTVEAGAEVVQTTESSLSQLVDRNIWQNAPLQVRNQNSFIELVAGAVPQDGTNNNRGAEVNGTRGGAGSYLVEGADNNEQGQAGRGQISTYDKGGAATSISPDAIQEYRVITNSYSAEYGKGGGFITDTVLKSGTNQWHGSAFEYNRIQALAANDWFSNFAGNKDALVRNQFGGSLGGPIVKDKTFWYGSGELHRARQTLPSQSTTSTTPEFLNFVQSGGLQQWAESDPNGLCNNQTFLDNFFGEGEKTAAPCPGAFGPIDSLPGSSTLGPIFTNLHSIPALHYPLATGVTCTAEDDSACRGRGNYTAGLLYPVPVYGSVTVPSPQSYNEARFTVKVDHRLSDKDSLSAAYLFQDGTLLQAFTGGNNLIGPDLIQDGRGQSFSATWNHTFNPTLLNTFKASYLRHRLDFPPAAGTFGTPGFYTNDGMGVDLGSSTGLPQFFTDNQFQYLDTISLTRGKHNIKLGGEYRRTRNGSSFFNDAFQTVVPYSIEDTVTDLAFDDQADRVLTGGANYGGAYYVSASVDNTRPGQSPIFYRGYRANEVALFVQDDFRVTSRLTVNLGLRWEYFGPPHNFQQNIDSNFYFGLPVTPFATSSSNQFFPSDNPFFGTVSTGTFQVRNQSIWNKDTNNFGPRVGFAWDVFGTQKFVVRAGGGIMYDRIYNNVFENIRFNPPFFSDNQIGPSRNGVTVGPISSPGLLTYPFTSQIDYLSGFSPVPNPRHMDQNMTTPYYEQAHLGLQWEFAKGWVFEPEYVTTYGKKLIGLSDINTFNGRVAFGTPCDPSTGDPADVVGCRPNEAVGADNFRSNGYGSNYHALQASVRKAYSSGLSINANYTWSKAIDDVSDLFNNGAGARPTDNENHSIDKGPADFDTRHRVVATVSYELPFMKGNRFLGGWGMNTIVSYQTGHPWTPFGGNAGAADKNKDGYRTDRILPNDHGVPTGSIESTKISGSPAFGTLDRSKWGFNPDTNTFSYFTCPATVNDGLWCDVPIGRNSVYGPGGANVDFNITKRFKITENSGLTFQANFFDLFNHPNFLNPTAGNAGSSNLRNGDFSSSRATWGDNGGHRVTQLALRFDF